MKEVRARALNNSSRFINNLSERNLLLDDQLGVRETVWQTLIVVLIKIIR
jgi:hypothetical protein